MIVKPLTSSPLRLSRSASDAIFDHCWQRDHRLTNVDHRQNDPGLNQFKQTLWRSLSWPRLWKLKQALKIHKIFFIPQIILARSFPQLTPLNLMKRVVKKPKTRCRKCYIITLIFKKCQTKMIFALKLSIINFKSTFDTKMERNYKNYECWILGCLITVAIKMPETIKKYLIIVIKSQKITNFCFVRRRDQRLRRERA